jgi:hypothetical protein
MDMGARVDSNSVTAPNKSTDSRNKINEAFAAAGVKFGAGIDEQLRNIQVTANDGQHQGGKVLLGSIPFELVLYIVNYSN